MIDGSRIADGGLIGAEGVRAVHLGCRGGRRACRYLPGDEGRHQSDGGRVVKCPRRQVLVAGFDHFARSARRPRGPRGCLSRINSTLGRRCQATAQAKARFNCSIKSHNFVPLVVTPLSVHGATIDRRPPRTRAQ